ncbi:MAG TPA: molybdopterin dinucleotide binding domain-containing protein [Gammaproteobacteria bacterium]|nr:molybdopterin dinucleotide binding domain-containing protein [Gammaproteobacteria bacterium]
MSQHIHEPIIEIHPEDAARFHLTDGALAKINSRWWDSVVGRATVTDRQRKGSLFIPIHWNDQFANYSRVDAAVNPATDPVSGQPASKHTPVMIELVKAAWSGFYLSRDKHPLPPCRYWSRQYGYGYWCYEIAGDELPEDSSAWAKSFMTDDPSEHEWLEYCDVTIGRYRAARIQDGKLISCLFISPEHKQPPRKTGCRLCSVNRHCRKYSVPACWQVNPQGMVQIPAP